MGVRRSHFTNINEQHSRKEHFLRLIEYTSILLTLQMQSSPVHPCPGSLIEEQEVKEEKESKIKQQTSKEKRSYSASHFQTSPRHRALTRTDLTAPPSVGTCSRLAGVCVCARVERRGGQTGGWAAHWKASPGRGAR